MNHPLAPRIANVKLSPTLAIAAKASELKRAGKDIISLSTGEPDFDTPKHIKQAAIDAIMAGFTKYTPVDGIPELKEAVCAKFLRDNGLKYSPKSVLISVGGKQSCYNLCQAVISAGDEVLIPAPYWVSYPDMVLLAEGTPVIISTESKNDYKITPESLEKAISPKTKLMFLNSPSNPSGKAYTAAELKALGEVLLKHPNVLIATDDMYEHILWAHEFVNILNVCPDLTSRTIVLNGVSKAYAMTGWRIGYCAGPQHIIDAMTIVQSQSTSNPCSIAQKAAVEALNGPQEDVVFMRDTFKRRHEYMVERLKSIPDMQVIPADGTFYIFPDVSKIIKRKGLKNDLEFCEKLLMEYGLAVVPGSAFGQEGAIRLSFAASDDVLKKALDRLTSFCNA